MFFGNFEKSIQAVIYFQHTKFGATVYLIGDFLLIFRQCENIFFGKHISFFKHRILLCHFFGYRFRLTFTVTFRSKTVCRNPPGYQIIYDNSYYDY